MLLIGPREHFLPLKVSIRMCITQYVVDVYRVTLWSETTERRDTTTTVGAPLSHTDGLQPLGYLCAQLAAQMLSVDATPRPGRTALKKS